MHVLEWIKSNPFGFLAASEYDLYIFPILQRIKSESEDFNVQNYLEEFYYFIFTIFLSSINTFPKTMLLTATKFSCVKY